MADDLVRRKILELDDLVSKLETLRETGNVVVQSHGVFDLIHPGIIRHFDSAKQQGDVLVVTVVKDKDVRKGPGRPIFPEEFRLVNVASLEQVDYVCLVDDEAPFECVQKISPDIFARGQMHWERDCKIHNGIFKRDAQFPLGNSRVHETDWFPVSSSQIINKFLDIYPEATKKFLADFRRRYSFYEIAEQVHALEDLKVLLIGEGIIDEYHYCESMGKSAKAHLVVSKYSRHEVFAGGAFAIANHVAGLCRQVQLVSLLGKQDSREEFISASLRPNVKAKFFYRQDGPTIVKKRYVNQYLNQKLFEVNYLNDNHINGDCEAALIDYLRKTIPEYDLVLVSDFGHGFITNRVIEVIERFSGKFAVNAQTNSANAGYNMITKYSNPHYVCLDEPELRLTAQDKHAGVEEVALKIKKVLNADALVVTLGKSGSIGVNGANEINRTPVFSSKVIDTVGAGDAFFAFTAPCFARGLPLDMVSFIGNAVGALAVQIVCNKKPVEKHDLLEFVHTLLH